MLKSNALKRDSDCRDQF